MISLDLLSVYNSFFPSQYKILKTDEPLDPSGFSTIPQKQSDGQTIFGSDVSYYNAIGQKIFLPIELYIDTELNIKIDCCTMRVDNKSVLIRTPLSERTGSAKEEYSTGDYLFSIEGVLIDRNRQFPSDQIVMIKNIKNSHRGIELRSPLGELFLEKSNRIVIESYNILSNPGKAIYHQPFSLTCESDFIDTLKVRE